MLDSVSAQNSAIPAERTSGRDMVERAAYSARPRARLPAALVVVASGALLAWNTARWTAQTDYADLLAHRRLWSDLADAVNVYLQHRFPSADVAEGDPIDRYRLVILERIRRDDVRPWQPWRTIGPRAFLPHRAQRALGPYDDRGRALLLGAAFRALGAVSPFLILWLGLLVCLPLLAWAVVEFFAAGRGVAGTAFAIGLACSPFYVETLALTRYAVGFYLVALVPLVALAVYAGLGTPTPRGLLLRAAAAGAALAVCTLCRSSSLLLLPGFALAVALGLWRARAASTGRRAWTAAAAMLLLLGPFLLVRQPGHHNVWSGFWEGLGDFDREKGHAWSDEAAEGTSQRSGGGPLWTERSEAVFRGLVLEAVRRDPLWYGAILVKRVAATVSQWKLWPWRPRDGTAVRARTSWNEGFIDKYYGYSTTADHLGLGPWRIELPVSAMLLPTAILLALSARRGDAALWVLAAAALATLPLPVLVSTAAAQETQAFALTYLLGFAFLLDALWRRRRR
jgi:hypothetical protein